MVHRTVVVSRKGPALHPFTNINSHSLTVPPLVPEPVQLLNHIPPFHQATPTTRSHNFASLAPHLLPVPR
jgi:hypothetical protein